jgi:hypothetical protein
MNDTAIYSSRIPRWIILATAATLALIGAASLAPGRAEA